MTIYTGSGAKPAIQYAMVAGGIGGTHFGVNMSGDFIVLIQKPRERLAEKRFTDFQSLVRYIEQNKTDDWLSTVSVHVPSQATDADREWLRKHGFQGDF